MALALVLAWPAYSTFACNLVNSARSAVADTATADKSNKPAERDCHKRADGQRTPAAKPCTDGGERLPQDRRSPLDTLPPLAPLVA